MPQPTILKSTPVSLLTQHKGGGPASLLELLPEPPPDTPLDDEDVASLPPASLLGLLLVEPPQLAGNPMAAASATRPKVARFIAP